MGSFDSLRSRDYRLVWTGAFLSNVGTWMQAIALNWYVFLLTRSAFWVSFVTFINFMPSVVSPIGGAYSDRYDLHLNLRSWTATARPKMQKKVLRP